MLREFIWGVRQEEGLDKNFAGLFVFWDRIFGTWYMPEGRHAQRFGLFGDRVPDSFWKRMIWPFRQNANVK
jgi:sterol desaturase/sphingolipid hydroxylase (fatty acid hydroxylase superfamily)